MNFSLGLIGATLTLAATEAYGAGCKPGHFRPPYFISTMGACRFDIETLNFRGDPVEQARCLMRGMDSTRNLSPGSAQLPTALTERVGDTTGLPHRDALAPYLAEQDLTWNLGAFLALPISRGHDNDPDTPFARYFVIHDTSGPNFGHRDFPSDLDGGASLNSLANFACADGWGRAHVVVNRAGAVLVNHDFSIPWRETKFEQAAEFGGALKGLFVHIEMIQPRRSAPGRGSRDDARSPDPAFTPVQYDRLALLYVVASVRAGRWLIPAFHAAIDAEIPNGHDDPLNFNIESFGASLDRLMDRLQQSGEMQAHQ